jgi:lipoate-protein ligase A
VGAKERVDDVYATINDIVTRALHDGFGIAVAKGAGAPTAAPAGLCFDAHTCYDLCAHAGKLSGKIFGSAQRRARDRFLLHGSLVIEPNPISEGAISLEELLGRKVELTEVEDAVIAASGFDLEDGVPTAEEEANTEALVRDRYANDAWTRRR